MDAGLSGVSAGHPRGPRRDALRRAGAAGGGGRSPDLVAAAGPVDPICHATDLGRLRGALLRLRPLSLPTRAAVYSPGRRRRRLWHRPGPPAKLARVAGDGRDGYPGGRRGEPSDQPAQPA